MPRPRTPFLTIRTEGALLPADLLQRIAAGDRDLAGLTPESYHLSGEKLNEAINRSWNRLLGAWAAFSAAREKDASEFGTSVTRERWLLPLFQELGYGRLIAAKAIEIDGKAYPVSHGWGEAAASVPIHLVGYKVRLDARTAGAAGAARTSPHSLVQELLNRDADRLWGFVSNGLRLRVLRDNASLTRQAFLEFDLEAMMAGEVYADFALLWLVCHQSRVEPVRAEGSTPQCWLEQWSKAAQARGARALDTLREGVQAAIEALGRGFLSHPANRALRDRLRVGNLSTQDYYRQLLRLVYRLIFLFVAEDRNLLFDPSATTEARERYARYYSTARLRRRAERQRGGRHADLYEGLRVVMALLGDVETFRRNVSTDSRNVSTGSRNVSTDEGNVSADSRNVFTGSRNVSTGSRNVSTDRLGLPLLGGFLFSESALPDLAFAQTANAELLAAVRSLAFTVEGKTRRAIDYRNLGPEELGSVYESLLELHPILSLDAGTFELRSASGSERKTTGSYYTPSSLIQCLIESALDPVIEAVETRHKVPQRSGEDVASLRDREHALLSLKVCDPACGSGHFLIAAAHRIAKRLAAVRSGDEEPAPEAMRTALRDVISHCIYGVDVNPMSVELCKVSLWMEALEPGKPLTFLDHHIQCGNSLIGATPALLAKGIPDEAFTPIEGDDKTVCGEYKKRNKKEREGQLSLFTGDLQPWERLGDLAASMALLDDAPDDTLEAARRKQAQYEELLGSQAYEYGRLWADAWCAAFVWKKTREFAYPITEEVFRKIEHNPFDLTAWMKAEILRLREQYQFFHWHIAFPEVFPPLPLGEGAGGEGGFDCVLGNPPWERIKLQEEEFFAARDPHIAQAANKAARQKLIKALAQTDPALARGFAEAKRAAEGVSQFVRAGGRFPLTAVGDVNTYALFAESARSLIATTGRVGIIVPTGIATDDTTKEFFGDLSLTRSLASLFDFENRAGLFPAVDSRMKFCALTMSRAPVEQAEFVFFATQVEHLSDTRRRFTLAPEDIALLNPNTRTMPVFRTRADAALTRKIYQRVPVLVNEGTGENPWGLRFSTMFHMSNDSGLFATEQRPGYLPLYEAKMLHQFDHRWATYDGDDVRDVTLAEKADPKFTVTPRYWVSAKEVDERLDTWERGWLLGFRDIARATDERTAIFSVLPRVGVGHTAPLMFGDGEHKTLLPCLLANLSSLTFDYVVRQKIGGTHLTYGYLRQLPAIPPANYTAADIDFIAPRVLELVYTAHNLKPFAEDMGYHGGPFKWDDPPGRRALLRAELDAYYAKLYGLTRDELRYILDPKDVYGPDFPGETFRVLKDKEDRLYGEYRTRRLVLEAWDRLMEGAS